MSDYRIEKITIGKLHEFAQKALTDGAHYKVLPITPERALAQSKNPAASKDDIGLLVIYHKDQCIGYRGFMPCWAKSGEDIYKLHAPTTFYVAPDYRGKIIYKEQTVAAYLNTVIFQSGYESIGTGISDYSVRYYKRDKRFRRIPPLPYLRINIGWIAPFSSAFRKLSRIKMLKTIRGFLNRCSHFSRKTIDYGISLILKTLLMPAGCENDPELDEIPVDKVLPLEENCKDVQSDKIISLYRDESIINWMLQYPWIKEDKEYLSTYYFAKQRERFEYSAYHLVEKKDRKHVGYVVYSISTENGYTTLKILDYKTLAKKYEPYILKLAMDISKNENVNVIEGSNDFWCYLRDRPLLRKITGRFDRIYLVWGKKDGIFEQCGYSFKLDYCDCDKPFS